MFAEFVWRNRWRVSIDVHSRQGIRIIYVYLSKGLPWEQPIGHVVSRDPGFGASSNASEEAVGVGVPTIKVICIIPLSEGLWKQATLPQKHPDKLQNNALEFVGVIVTFVILTEWHRGRESQFPPHPVASILCDNTSAVAWCQKMSTNSTIGENLLRLFAEFRLLSPIGIAACHIAGVDNTLADFLSRPCNLYSPPLSAPSDRTVFSHIQQACLKKKELASWTVFLPTPELLSALCLMLSSNANWERPKSPRNNGVFVPCTSILSGSSSKTNSMIPFSL
jgi:hypothetical protein